MRCQNLIRIWESGEWQTRTGECRQRSANPLPGKQRVTKNGPREEEKSQTKCPAFYLMSWGRVLERETRLVLATLCLGSTLVGFPNRIDGQEVGQEWGDFGPFSLLQIRREGRCPWWRS